MSKGNHITNIGNKCKIGWKYWWFNAIIFSWTGSLIYSCTDMSIPSKWVQILALFPMAKIFSIICWKISNCIDILISRDCPKASFPKQLKYQEREHWKVKIVENLKENINLVPHSKGVQFFPISKNVDDYPNSEGALTLVPKIVTVLMYHYEPIHLMTKFHIYDTWYAYTCIKTELF